ncbi:MAG: DegV family protein [Eubacteriales bacterium]
MGVKIIADSISDLSTEVSEKYGIEVLPIEFLIDGTFISAYELDVDVMMNKIREKKKTPEIKGVSTDTYTEVFRRYVNEGMEIVCITAGDMTVSNYASACHASTSFPDASIHIIDSHQISTTIGMMALRAAEMAQGGDSAATIARSIERNMDKFKQFGLADTVDFLQFSGHCPKIVAMGSNLLHAKFEFAVYNDQKFDVKMVGNSMSKALPSFFNDVFKDLRSIKSKKIFMVHTPTKEEYFSEFYKKVTALNYFDDIIVSKASLHSTSLYGNNGISVAYELK